MLNQSTFFKHDFSVAIASYKLLTAIAFRSLSPCFDQRLVVHHTLARLSDELVSIKNTGKVTQSLVVG